MLNFWLTIFRNIKPANIGSLLIPLGAILLAYVFPGEDIKSLMTFTLLTLVFSVYRLNSQILVGYGIALLIIIAALTFVQSKEAASQVSVIAYWTFLSAVVCILIEYYKNSRSLQVATESDVPI